MEGDGLVKELFFHLKTNSLFSEGRSNNLSIVSVSKMVRNTVFFVGGVWCAVCSQVANIHCYQKIYNG